jgi:hypothetical protein
VVSARRCGAQSPRTWPSLIGPASVPSPPEPKPYPNAAAPAATDGLG